MNKHETPFRVLMVLVGAGFVRMFNFVSCTQHAAQYSDDWEFIAGHIIEFTIF
jgi:hypothetical protein